MVAHNYPSATPMGVGNRTIIAERLVKRFGTFTAVNGISFVVQSGEVYDFLGPNGAGKSTVVPLLTTLSVPTAGQATVGGYDVMQQAVGVRRVAGVALQEIGIALLLGIGFSGLAVGIALVSGNSAATNSSVILFFPLTLLTATFVPVDLLQGWIKVVARLNPVTYVLEAMRAIRNTGWEAAVIGRGLLASPAMFVVLFAWALYGLGARTRRR